MSKKGFLITFEGGEGCGKSTHSQMFCEYLVKQGFDVLHTREPGGTKLSEAIRDLVKDSRYIDKTPECELLLFEAARAEICQKVLRPALESGKIVVLDRFYDSTTAYQGYGRGLDIQLINRLNNFATNGLTPDLTFYLRIEPRVAFRRKGGAEQNDAIELESLDFHNRVKNGFDIIARNNSDRYIIIDSDNDQDVVAGEIIDKFEEKYAQFRNIQENTPVR